MAYSKQVFSQGQVLTAPHLNHIENGIAQNDVAITELKNTTGTNYAELTGKIAETNSKVGVHDTRLTEVETSVGDTKSELRTTQSSVATLEENTRNTFANAIKGTATGSVVTLTDVSPIEHTVVTTVSGVVNPTEVKVIRCGKNILGFRESFSRSVNGITLDYDHVTGTFTLHGTPTTKDFPIMLSDYMEAIFLDVGTSVSLSVEHLSGTYETDGLSVFYLGTGDTVGERSNWFSVPFIASGTNSATNASIKKYFTHSWIYIASFNNMSFDNYKFKLWVELGESATTYEKDDLATYAPSADGLVQNVTSRCPTTNLFTNSEDAVLTVEYIRDSNSVINDLIKRISTLENA